MSPHTVVASLIWDHGSLPYSTALEHWAVEEAGGVHGHSCKPVWVWA